MENRLKYSCNSDELLGSIKRLSGQMDEFFFVKFDFAPQTTLADIGL